MPYLSKTFNHVIADSSVNTWSYEKRTDEIINFSSYLKERKGYTDQFFADLKEMLQQTNLTITFDDDNNTFNVFDMDFIFPNLVSYVNDAIGYRMDAEKILYFSENAYGTADAICFRNKCLRVHDYKSGRGTVKMDQLYIYVALFCLEYNIKPGEIEIETRLYHANEILTDNPTAEDILPIMDAIVINDKFLSKIRAEGM